MDGKQEICDIWRERRRRQSEIQEQLRREAFERLCAGQVATDAALGRAVGLLPAQVEQELAPLAEQGLLIRNDEGVVGIYGLTLLPTAHRLRLGRQPLYTWCALDAVGIPAGLESDASAEAKCFQCNEPIQVAFRAGRVAAASQTDLCIWLTRPEEGRSAVGET